MLTLYYSSSLTRIASFTLFYAKTTLTEMSRIPNVILQENRENSQSRTKDTLSVVGPGVKTEFR